MISSSAFAMFVNHCTASKGRFGITIVTSGDEHRLLKRQLKAAAGDGHVVKKIVETINPIIGWNYEAVVKRRLKKDGADPDDFTSSPMSGRVWVAGLEEFVSHKSSDPDTLYLRTYFTGATKVARMAYVFDDHVATPQEEALIKSCLSTRPTFSAKQLNAGLDEEHQVEPRDFLVSNIHGISQPSAGINFGLSYDQLLSGLIFGTITL